jgi:hypothetical protein
MKFSDQPPSEQWNALTYKGELLAEVWFKPEGSPFAVAFRVPQKTFASPVTASVLTVENLLKGVGIAAAEVDSWRLGDSSHPGMNVIGPEFRTPLPQPAPDITHLHIRVDLQPPPRTATGNEPDEAKISSLKWQDLEARWDAILSLEASIETLRLTMEGIRVELDAASKKTLAPEDRLHARRDDVARWNREKTRVHFVVPKLKEFVHRATWAATAPERKMLDEIFKEDAEPILARPELIKVADLLESLLKDRQVLSAHGVTVHQECKSIAANIKEALRTLQSNAAANRNKKQRGIQGSKFFKDARRLTGLE